MNINFRFSKSVLILLLVISTLLAICGYLVIRTILFIIADYAWFEKVMAFFLLFAEVFIMMHGFGYFLNLFHVIRHPASPKILETDSAELTEFPLVAIIVSSFKEPLDVLEETLTCFYNVT